LVNCHWLWARDGGGGKGAAAFGEKFAHVAGLQEVTEGVGVVYEHAFPDGEVLETPEVQVQFGRGGVGQGVNGPIAVAGGVDEAVFPQVGQVPGHVDLGDVEHVLQVADTEGGGAEQVENPETGFVAEAFVHLKKSIHGSSIYVFAYIRK